MGFAAMSTAFISLFLLGGALLLGRQTDLLIDASTANVEVTVYLSDPPKHETVTHLTGILEDLVVVESVHYESKQEAYERFQRLFGENSAMVQNTSADALPASLRVKLADPERFAEVKAALEGQPGIDKIVDLRALLNTLFAVIRFFRLGVGAVAVLMMISAAVLIANTVRTGLFARRKEIGIMKLVGATNWRIRMPFLIEGVVEALIGAGAAILALFVLKTVFVDPNRTRLQFMPFIQSSDVVQVIPILLGAGVFVAIFAGFVAMRRFLDV